MFKIITTFTAIGLVMISPAFIAQANAQNAEVEIINETAVQAETAIPEDDALNYFASGAKMEEEQAAAQVEQGIDGPAIPARELQYLPESLEIGGKGSAQVQVIDGRLVTKTMSAPQVPQNMEGQAQPSPAAQPASVNPSEAPKTLNAQLREKQGVTAVQPAAAPAAPAAQQPAPAPVPVQNAATPEENSAAAIEPATGVNAGVNVGVNVGQAAIVDRAKGAKINIISNTDTGVHLGQ